MNIHSAKKEILSEIDKKIDFFIKMDFPFTLKDKIGLCVINAYKYLKYSNEQYFNNTHLLFEDIINTQNYQSSDIIEGASGVIWLVNFLERINLMESNKDMLKPIKEKISEDIKICLESNNWDFYHGAIGRAVALDDADNYKIIVDYFTSRIKDNKKNNLFLSEYYKTSINMGLHAGILGILSIVNLLNYRNLFTEDCFYLRSALLDLIFNKLDDLDWKCYPALYERNYPSRMCWTYGELILALQLLITDNLTEKKRLTEKAIKVAHLATKRNSMQQAYIQDACILNGSVGNYYIYKMLNKLDENQMYTQSQNIWLQFTLQILRKNSYSTIDRYTNLLNNDFSIISGLTGIYLSIEDFDIKWHDYVLMPTY